MTYREYALVAAMKIVDDAPMYSPSGVEAALKILVECSEPIPAKYLPAIELVKDAA